MNYPVRIVAEGDVDAAVAMALVWAVDLQVGTVYVKGGKAGIDARLRGYNNAARQTPWLVLRDLDRDADCAPELIDRLLPEPAAGMLFRIPVRSIESWLLADTTAAGEFLAIPINRVPNGPERLADPKSELISLARTSRSRIIRNGLVPKPDSGRRVGPEYNSLMISFVRDRWSCTRAENSGRALSLGRALDALRRLRDSVA